MAAPSMKERQACWGARDEYWKCLDENTDDASQCKKLRSTFESSCPQQWSRSRGRPPPHLCALFRDGLWSVTPQSSASNGKIFPEPCEKIKYFDKRRDYLKFKEKFEAGQFQPSETTAKS